MRATLAALALVLSVGACSDIAGLGNLTGNYDLQRVDGQLLPYVADESLNGTYRLELTRSTLVLHRDGTYTTTFTWRETIRGSVVSDTETFDGTYERTGNDIYLYDDFDGTTTIARVEGGRLFIDSDGITFEYR
jgi:hypothetical protein